MLKFGKGSILLSRSLFFVVFRYYILISGYKFNFFLVCKIVEFNNFVLVENFYFFLLYCWIFIFIFD